MMIWPSPWDVPPFGGKWVKSETDEPKTRAHGSTFAASGLTILGFRLNESGHASRASLRAQHLLKRRVFQAKGLGHPRVSHVAVDDVDSLSDFRIVQGRPLDP